MEIAVVDSNHFLLILQHHNSEADFDMELSIAALISLHLKNQIYKLKINLENGKGYYRY